MGDEGSNELRLHDCIPAWVIHCPVRHFSKKIIKIKSPTGRTRAEFIYRQHDLVCRRPERIYKEATRISEFIKVSRSMYKNGYLSLYYQYTIGK